MPLTRRKFIGAGTALAVAGRAAWASDDRSPVGLGTNRYRVGDADNNERLRQTLAAFVEAGGSVIDTAPRYRTSEQILGRLIGELNIREWLFLATKCNLDADKGGGEQLEQSHKKLGTTVIDLMQLHNLAGANSMLPVLREHRADGRIDHIGITTSRHAQFDEMLRLMESESLDYIQVNYSLADRTAAERILPLAFERGIKVLINVPFGRGRLFSAVEGRELPEWAADFDCTSWAHFFLKYVISHPAVTCAIPGTTRAVHAIDNQGAARGRMPTETERRRQEKWFNKL